MFSTLIIWGKFDPDEITRGLDITIDSTWREGDPIRDGRQFEDSGIQIRVSAPGYREYKELFAEAEAFLRKHQAALGSMTTHKDTLESVLDFGLRQARHPAYFRRIPASLIQISAELRLAIEISLYASSDDPSPASEDEGGAG